MPVSSNVYRNPDLQHVYAWGDVSRDEVRRQFAEGPDMPGLYLGIPTLIDLTRMQVSDLALPDIMALRDRIVERHIKAETTFRAAILSGSDTSFGMARIFETLCDDTKVIAVEVFREYGEAFAFLGLAGSRLEQELFSLTEIRTA